MSNVVVKQGSPSKSGEVVDTTKAKVVPASPEVKTEAAAREVATQKKATQAKVGAAAKKMTHPARAKDEAVKAVTGKAKPAAKKPAAKGRVDRLTTTWTGKDKRDVQVKDTVKLADGTVVTCVGRWTKKTKDGNVPFITGTTKDGTRKNSPAAEVTHVKK